MKKLIIFSIIVILTFFISFYIGMKIETPNKEVKTSQETKNIKEQDTEHIEQAASENNINREHYVLRSVNKYIKVYSIDDKEKEELYLSTDISTEYLPETDKISLKEGIHVYSKKELNEILQDFE